MATRPLKPIKVPESLKAENVVEVLRRSRGDYSSENIRSSIQKMIDAGQIDKSIAGHLAMVSVYAGDRIEGIGAGQAQLGGMKPADERYFEGSPEELKAMRRKRSGTRQEFATSVPVEYQPILKQVFQSKDGRKAVARALRVRMEEGKIPTNERSVERYKEAIADVRFAKPTASEKVELSVLPSDADKDPVLGSAPGRDRAKTESRKMSTAKRKAAFRVLRARMPGGRDMTAAERRKLGATEKVEVAGPARSKYAVDKEAKKKAIEEAEELSFSVRPKDQPKTPSLQSRVRGPENALRRLVGPLMTARTAAAPLRKIDGERVRSTASAQPQSSDMPMPRKGKRKVVRGQALPGARVASRMRPTKEGVVARLAALAEPGMKQDIEPMDWSRRKRRLGGAHENVLVEPPARPKKMRSKKPVTRQVKSGSFKKSGRATRKPIEKRPGKGPGLKETLFARMARMRGGR
jgi:hypothetical protein